MLHRTFPSRTSSGRRSYSTSGLFADARGVIHIRIPHRAKPGKVTKTYRSSLVALWCEKGGEGIEEITAVSEDSGAFPTCVRCIAMEK